MAQEGPLPSGNNGESSVFIGAVLLKLQNSVARALSQIRQKVIQSFIVFFVVFLLLWISAFLYGSLYYSYMPNAAFSTAVHYYYRLVFQVLSSCTRKTQEWGVSAWDILPLHLIFFILSRLVLQNRLWISCFTLVLLPSGKHLNDPKQKTCMCCATIFVNLCRAALNTSLFIRRTFNLFPPPGDDIWPSLSHLPAAGDARISNQSGPGDVHDQNSLFFSGWRPSCLFYTHRKLYSFFCHLTCLHVQLCSKNNSSCG